MSVNPHTLSSDDALALAAALEAKRDALPFNHPDWYVLDRQSRAAFNAAMHAAR